MKLVYENTSNVESFKLSIKLLKDLTLFEGVKDLFNDLKYIMYSSVVYPHEYILIRFEFSCSIYSCTFNKEHLPIYQNIKSN